MSTEFSSSHASAQSSRAGIIPRENRPHAKAPEAQALIGLCQEQRWEAARALLLSRQWGAALDPDFGLEDFWPDIACYLGGRLENEGPSVAPRPAAANDARRAFAKSLRHDGDWMIAARDWAHECGSLDLESGPMALDIELAALGDVGRSRSLVVLSVKRAAAFWHRSDLSDLWALDSLSEKKGVRGCLSPSDRIAVLASWGQADPQTFEGPAPEGARESGAALLCLRALERHGFVSPADYPAFLERRLRAQSVDWSDVGCVAFAILSQIGDSLANSPSWPDIRLLLEQQMNDGLSAQTHAIKSWQNAQPLIRAVIEQAELISEISVSALNQPALRAASRM